jgi:hypothetical protein
MHLPKSVYEVVPHYWIVVGILLVLLGLDSEPGTIFRYFSIALGALSTAWGMMILLKRRSARRVKDSEASA